MYLYCTVKESFRSKEELLQIAFGSRWKAL